MDGERQAREREGEGEGEGEREGGRDVHVHRAGEIRKEADSGKDWNMGGDGRRVRDGEDKEGEEKKDRDGRKG